MSSILNRLGVTPHLSEADLAEVWTAAAIGEPVTSPHLQRCAECRVRYAAFTSWADSMREDTQAEADLAFPPERLKAQQAAIARRLEVLERPARVIAFPRHTGPSATRHPLGQRWIAAAAAAGLIVGIGLGQIWNFRPQAPVDSFVGAPQSMARAQESGRNTAGRITPVSAVATLSDEDESLFEPLPSPRIDALNALDTITPRIRDYEPR
jgi:hypothetical protein